MDAQDVAASDVAIQDSALVAQSEKVPAIRHDETIEERAFAAALICLEGHYTRSPPMGPQTTAKVASLVSRTLDKTHICRRSREALSCNVSIWIWLTRIFAAAIPTLTSRSVGPLSSLNDPDKGVTPQESTALIVMNHASIKEDLTTLIKLMHIARNMLVNVEPEVPQDICAAVHFDQMVYQTIILCVNVTSKGYDGEILDEVQRSKLTEITEHYKKLLVTSLQQAHNWTAKHDRNKMSFWFDVLFDDDDTYAQPDGGIGDGSGFRPDVAKQQTQHWLDRNSRMCDTARALLKDYAENHADKPPGNLAPIRPLAWNWLPDGMVPGGMDKPKNKDEKISPVWKPDEPDRFEQDRVYGRVSREIDTWWLRARDPNHDHYVIDMPTTEVASARLEHCKQNVVHRHPHSYRGDHSPPSVVAEADFSDHDHCPDCHGCRHDHDNHDDDEHEHEHNHDHDDDDEHTHDHDDDHDEHDPDCPHHHDHHHHHHDYEHDYADDLLDDDEADDDDCYGDGPLTGLLTEIPNILDPKQIEALHMIVKSCILDNAGSGLTQAGENLQKTRCRMFLGLECGRSLLREMLVFIAVWEKEEQSLIFQVTTQIVEAIHHSALIPYAWSCLRIPKDIISPAQTVLLRLVNHMFRARVNASHTPSSSQGSKDAESAAKDIKLVHFFFAHFRTRIVPECAALMHIQTQIGEGQCDAAEFPVDSWDMERARDGLAQYLDFLTTAAEIVGMRMELIGWEAVYDLLVILNALETAVPKKQLVELPKKAGQGESTHNMIERPYSATDGTAASPPPPPPSQDPAYKFPWAGIKGQIFTILATMLQPPPGQSSPGNPAVQEQIVKWNGIVPLLNSCAYDDHNPFAKERVTICLKWLLDGCETANTFLRELVSLSPQPDLKPGPGGKTVSTLRVDGILGDVKVQVQPDSDKPPLDRARAQEMYDFIRATVNKKMGSDIESDFMA